MRFDLEPLDRLAPLAGVGIALAAWLAHQDSRGPKKAPAHAT